MMKLPNHSNRGILLAALTGLFIAPSAFAHHPMGGGVSQNALDGLISGLAHPIIGVDHLVVVIAVGILAAAMKPGLWIPFCFVLGTLAGTTLHLFRMGLPAQETLILFSVLGVGILLVLRRAPNAAWPVTVGSVAGMLHGYAYAEAIVGAEAGTLAAYLIGFSAIQLVVAGGAYMFARKLQAMAKEPGYVYQAAGFAVCGAAIALLATQAVAFLLPA